MVDVFAPRDERDVADLVAQAANSGTPLEVAGYRTKRLIGRPVNTGAALSTGELSGVTLYEPNELVISARPGTSLAQIESLLASNNQELAFEPIDLSRAVNKRPLGVSIGGVFATNASGPRRILRGAARDHLLGVRAVNGRGEVIKSGGRVMKNVTGVDLVRGLAGSWGTLGVLTEVTMKVLPKAEETRTLIFMNLPDEAAIGLMCAALGTPYEVSGTVHLQAPLAKRIADKDLADLGYSISALRLETFSASMLYRIDRLRRDLSPFGEVYELDHGRSLAFWSDMRGLSYLAGTWPLWRITVSPAKAAQLVGALRAIIDCRAAFDWSGGLIWLEVPPSMDANAADLRRIIGQFDADAMLIRAEPHVRAAVEVFQPLPEANMNLIRRLKHAFDPMGILNPGRMYAGV
ncbi:MAG: FAD-binding protein [Hyphomicrobiales bacterium]|nr:FAD-binding protein [Hyphomicrobiales bacterium]